MISRLVSKIHYANGQFKQLPDLLSKQTPSISRECLEATLRNGNMPVAKAFLVCFIIMIKTQSL